MSNNSVTIQKYADWISSILAVESVTDRYCTNGLQVCGDPQQKLTRAAFAVDACMEVFHQAAEWKAGILVVHHGLFWPDIRQITGIQYRRIEALIRNNIALYNVHIPLDAHTVYGNNAVLARIAGAGQIKSIFNYAVSCTFKKKKPINSIAKLYEAALNTGVKTVIAEDRPIHKVIICSGGGAGILHKINDSSECDLFITGEQNHSIFHEAKEKKINVLFTGHYASETTGIKEIYSLSQKKFDFECRYFDSPSGM